MTNNHKQDTIMHRKSSSGFAAIEALLIVIILAMIGFIGWYVWHTKQNTDKTYNTASQTTQSNVAPKTKNLTISEWGVRAAYSGSLNLSYKIDAQGNAEFSAKQLDDLVAGSNVSCQGYAGWIARYAASEHINNDNSLPTAADAPSSYGLVHVGAYYYMFIHAQAECSGSLPLTLSASQQAQLQTLLTQANNDVKALTTALKPVSD